MVLKVKHNRDFLTKLFRNSIMGGLSRDITNFQGRVSGSRFSYSDHLRLAYAFRKSSALRLLTFPTCLMKASKK